MPSDFVPKRRLVSGVTIASKAVVTTTEAHGYETGLLVRLFVPADYGMSIYQETYIVVTGDMTFITQLDTTSQRTFIVPAQPYTPAQVVPITGVTDNIA